jgi:hypothetical protein
MESIAVHFESEILEVKDKKIPYEWAHQQINENHRLVFHFFLGLKHKDIDFTMAMVSAAETIPEITFEIFYTPDFDGHDLIINNINIFAKQAIKNSVMKSLKDTLTPK